MPLLPDIHPDRRPQVGGETADDERRPDAELHRIDFAGAAWFAAAAIAAAVPLAGLLASGWRPAELPLPTSIAWWVGVTVLAVGLALLAWAGCPVLGPDLDRTVQGKSLAIRAGLALFGVGAVASLLAVLLTGRDHQRPEGPKPCCVIDAPP